MLSDSLQAVRALLLLYVLIPNSTGDPLSAPRVFLSFKGKNSAVTFISVTFSFLLLGMYWTTCLVCNVLEVRSHQNDLVLFLCWLMV